MNASSAAARRTIRTRTAQTRLTASLHRGRSIATHVLAAGVDADAVAGVVNGLRSVAKRLHVEPVKVTRTPRTIHGRDGHGHRCGHYTAAQIQLLVSEYRPRKASYIAAAHQLAA